MEESEKMSRDEMSRSKILQTVMLFLVFIFTGFAPSIIGPTIPDLQIAFQVGLDKVSFLLLAVGFGEICGVCLACIILPRMDNNLLTAVCFVTGISSLSLVPVGINIYGATVCVAIYSASVGVLINVVTYKTNVLWPNTAYPVHFVLSGAAVGAVLAPSIAGPFLNAGGSHTRLDTNYNFTNLNMSDPHEKYLQKQSSTNMTQLFVLSGCINVPIIACLLYNYFKCRKLEFKNECLSGHISLSPKGNVLIAAFLFLFSIPYMANCLTLGSLLSTFGIHSNMHLSASYMAGVTSVFWASFLFGKIVNTIVSRCFTQLQLILLALGGLLLTVTLLATIARKYMVALWIGSSAFGFFASPFPAVTLAWLREYVTLTETTISLCFLGSTVGIAIEPFIAGILISWWGPNMLMYFLAGAVCFQCFTFASLYFVTKLSVR